MSGELYIPAVLDLDRWKKALWALERKDGRGLYLWDEHSQKDMKPGEPTEPIKVMCVWTTADAAEEYNEYALRNTGRLYAITQGNVMSHLRALLKEGIEWIFFNKPHIDTERTQRVGIAKIRDVIEYLSGGGQIGDGRSS